jgi:large subunit ribosomal protein L23
VAKFNPRNLPDLIRRPLVTEKATMLFEVAPKATKPQIREAIEELFEVKVVSVNTQTPPRKDRRVGKFLGHRAQYKRAVVTLASGDSITLFPEV